ncbi:MAG TPA: type VI secretion system tube protein Hcp [Acetobacteraceae bacterium]|jgi:type VI secretion system secreted protein Hcp
MASIYMFYDGIDGPVTISGLEKSIELTSFRWGFEREGNKALDGSSSWARPPSVREVTVTKPSDKTTTMLIQKGLASDSAATVKFKFTSTAQTKIATYMAFELSGCIISNFAIAGSDGIPEETLSLNFTKIVVTFTPRDVGLTGSPTSTTYDLKQAKTS